MTIKFREVKTESWATTYTSLGAHGSYTVKIIRMDMVQVATLIASRAGQVSCEKFNFSYKAEHKEILEQIVSLL